MSYLVTGGAGFIGSHLCESLLKVGVHLVVIDNESRELTSAAQKTLQTFKSHPNIQWIQGDFADPGTLKQLPEIKWVFHLAARTGVRESVRCPQSYQDTNIEGFKTLLKWAKTQTLNGFIFASSSSVYGNQKGPWTEGLQTAPLSPYAQTKQLGEHLLQAFAEENKCPSLALRFFTVYGPRQRPDMAIYKFTKALLNREDLHLNNPNSQRDYTHISDIIQGVLQAKDYLSQMRKGHYEVFNLGSSQPIALKEVVQLLTQILKSKSEHHILEQAESEAVSTWANLQKSQALLGYNPNKPFKEGIHDFCQDFLAKERGHHEISFKS